MRREIGRRRDDKAADRTQFPGYERGIRQNGDAQRRVEALSTQVDHGIAQMQVDRHLRIEPEKAR
jgi:hypothetical protein